MGRGYGRGEGQRENSGERGQGTEDRKMLSFSACQTTQSPGFAWEAFTECFALFKEKTNIWQISQDNTQRQCRLQTAFAAGPEIIQNGARQTEMGPSPGHGAGLRTLLGQPE